MYTIVQGREMKKEYICIYMLMFVIGRINDGSRFGVSFGKEGWLDLELIIGNIWNVDIFDFNYFLTEMEMKEIFIYIFNKLESFIYVIFYI